MSHDALRMRLRRLCEVKPRTNKCHVDTETHTQWKRGGESREWLEIALAEAMENLGVEKNQHKKLRVSWFHHIPDQSIWSLNYSNLQSSKDWLCNAPSICFIHFLLRRNSPHASSLFGNVWNRRSRKQLASG